MLLRVTPGIKPSTHDFISTGQLDSKFGLAPDDARSGDRARAAPPTGSSCVGLHMHIGSQIFELESFRRAIEALAHLGDFPVYDLGGGLGVAYTAGDEPPSIEDYVEAKVTAAHELLGADARLLLEPGRALTANSTVTLYTVESVKRGALDLRRGRRRHVRQPAPDALRGGLRGRDRRSPRTPAASAATSPASTASPATCWSTTCTSTIRGPATCS